MTFFSTLRKILMGRREIETVQLPWSIGSSLKSLTSIHALCSLCEEAPYSLNEAVLVFVSKPRGKIIMMRDAAVNNGGFLRLIRDSCLE